MNLKILDCTLRDGGNLNDWNFTGDEANKIVSLLGSSNIDIIEVGYLGGSGSNPAEQVGLCADTPPEFLENLPSVPADLAIMAVPSVCPLEKLEILKNSKIKLVRIASYVKDIKDVAPYIEYVKKMNLSVSVNLMAVSYVEIPQVIEIAKKMESLGADIFYMADSFGAMFPEDVEKYISGIVENTKIKVGFHSHNNLGLAFTNTIQAIRSGASYIDTSLCGMARGAGNLPTEQLVSALQKWKNYNYSDSKVIEAAEYVLNHILNGPMKIAKQEIKCGLYNIHYYYYDILVEECKKRNLDPDIVGKILGEMKPDSIKKKYIEKACEISGKN